MVLIVQAADGSETKVEGIGRGCEERIVREFTILLGEPVTVRRATTEEAR